MWEVGGELRGVMEDGPGCMQPVAVVRTLGFTLHNRKLLGKSYEQ